MKLELEEIARRLFKANWADMKEHKQALDAMAKLSDKELEQLEEIGQTYINHNKRAAKVARNTMNKLQKPCSICGYSTYACVCS